MTEPNIPYFRRIHISFVESLPTNKIFFETIYPPISKLYGYFIFRLNECIDPECKKKGLCMIVSPEYNPKIIDLCNKFLKKEITELELYPYYIPP